MEILKDVFKPFYERLRRPFLGAFSVSWVFANWKIWITIFAYPEVINNIDKIQYISSLLTIDNLVYKPLCYSGIFLLITPILDLVVFGWQDMFRFLKRKVQGWFDEITPPTPETHKRLKELKDSLEDKVLRMEGREQSLKDKVKDLEGMKRVYDRARLDINPGFFEGDWRIENSRDIQLFLRFTSRSEIFIINPRISDKPKGLGLFKVVQMVNDGRFLRILTIRSTSHAERKTYFDGNFNQDGKSNFQDLLLRDTPGFQIELERMTKNSIELLFLGSGFTLGLNRENDGALIPDLWTNDNTGEFRLKY